MGSDPAGPTVGVVHLIGRLGSHRARSRIVLSRSRERGNLRGARACARPHLPRVGRHQLRHRLPGAVRRLHVHVPASGQALPDHPRAPDDGGSQPRVRDARGAGAHAGDLGAAGSGALRAGVPAAAPRTALGEGGGLAGCARRAAGVDVGADGHVAGERRGDLSVEALDLAGPVGAVGSGVPGHHRRGLDPGPHRVLPVDALRPRHPGHRGVRDGRVRERDLARPDRAVELDARGSRRGGRGDPDRAVVPGRTEHLHALRGARARRGRRRPVPAPGAHGDRRDRHRHDPGLADLSLGPVLVDAAVRRRRDGAPRRHARRAAHHQPRGPRARHAAANPPGASPTSTVVHRADRHRLRRRGGRVARHQRLGARRGDHHLHLRDPRTLARRGHRLRRPSVVGAARPGRRRRVHVELPVGRLGGSVPHRAAPRRDGGGDRGSPRRAPRAAAAGPDARGRDPRARLRSRSDLVPQHRPRRLLRQQRREAKGVRHQPRRGRREGLPTPVVRVHVPDRLRRRRVRCGPPADEFAGLGHARGPGQRTLGRGHRRQRRLRQGPQLRDRVVHRRHRRLPARATARASSPGRASPRSSA